MWSKTVSRAGVNALPHRVSTQRLALFLDQKLVSDLHLFVCNLPTHKEKMIGLKAGWI